MKRQFDYFDELDYRLGQELDPIWKTSDGQEKHRERVTFAGGVLVSGRCPITKS